MHAQLMRYYAASLDRLVAFLGTLSDASRQRRVEVATLLMTSIEGAYLLLDATPLGGERLATCLEEMTMRMLEG